jgi:hypothetical protein
MSERAKVQLGMLAPTLAEQGFDDDNGQLQIDAVAIGRLYVRGYLTESQRDSAERKLVRRLHAREVSV